MHFSIYLPPGACSTNKVPVLYWLSGLACTDQNFATKAGAQRMAAKLGLAIAMPDTSPRGDNVPDDPKQEYDLGLGAGFYVNASQAPWQEHYQMYSYIVDELPALLQATLPINTQRAIAGHSMGGHGALMIALKNPGLYASSSAFAPIVNPVNCPWGIKAFGAYLGEHNSALWRQYDTVELIRAGADPVPMLIDQGTADPFLHTQLQTEALQKACADTGFQATIRHQAGYDHSYYFIASLIEDHLKFHAQHLQLIN